MHSMKLRAFARPSWRAAAPRLHGCDVFSDTFLATVRCRLGMISTFRPMPSRPSIPTRPSLLARLSTGDDVEAWMEFYRVYGDLLRRFALKGGLTESEAEEVVQETAIGIARNLPGFRYDPAVCSFKTWMLNFAHWRIHDALRRRGTSGRGESPVPTPVTEDVASATSLIERIADPHPPQFGAEWDAAWEQELREAALGRLRQVLNPKHFQIFDLFALQGRPVREVALRLGVSVPRVYFVRQQVAALLRREMNRLARGEVLFPIPGATRRAAL